MYQQWDSRCRHSDFDFSPFSIAGIVKMRLGRQCNPKFALLASLFAIRTNMRVRNNLFWHVYGNTSCSTVVDDVTQTIFMTIFIGYDWQLSCILGLSLTSLRLLLKSKVFVTNSSRFPNIKIHIFWGKYCKSMIIRSQVKEIHICGLSPSFTAQTLKMALGSHVIQKFHC